MTIAPDSTSYPVLAVIVHHNATADEARRLYDLAHRMRTVLTTEPLPHHDHLRFMAEMSGLPWRLGDPLADNMWRTAQHFDWT